MGRSLSYPSALEDTLGTNNLDGLSAPTIRVLDIGAGPDVNLVQAARNSTPLTAYALAPVHLARSVLSSQLTSIFSWG
jgi:hypothetical protein